MSFATMTPEVFELIAERLWLVADGAVRPFDGDLDDYRALLAERGRPAGKTESAGRKDDRRDRAAARAALAPLRRQAKEAEALLMKLSVARAEIEAQLADPTLYAAGRARDVAAANARLAAIRKQAEAAETSWLAAEEALEAAS